MICHIIIKNYLLENNDLINIFQKHGLENIKINNINLFRTAFVHQSYCTMKNLDFKNSNSKCLTIVFHYKICRMKDLNF